MDPNSYVFYVFADDLQLRFVLLKCRTDKWAIEKNYKFQINSNTLPFTYLDGNYAHF